MFNPKGVTGESPGQRPGVSLVATRCQAVGVARKTSTVWRRVATFAACGNSSPPAAKRWELRGKRPPSGDAWLPTMHAATRSYPLQSGGDGQENPHSLACVAPRFAAEATMGQCRQARGAVGRLTLQTNGISPNYEFI